jgi:NADPH:quinone reductase-like Zn-dependent oxidoreductase
MRAWTYTQRGSPLSVLNLTNIATPHSVPPNHVQIKVTYCSLNPTSTMLMKLLPNPFGHIRVPELDFAGVITSNGSNAPSLRVRNQLTPGTRVFGATYGTPVDLLLERVTGTLTEYIIVHEDSVAITPEGISSDTAAGLGAVGCTSVRFLEYSKVGPGDSILINGASGGLGTFLVQLAKHVVGSEGTVVGICSTANVDLVKNLGADEVVPYNGSVPPEQYLAKAYGGHKKFDTIIDTVGVQSLYTHCPAYLKEGKSLLNAGVLPYTGSGIWGAMSLTRDLLANYFWPKFLGGTDRKYELLKTDLVPGLLEKVRIVVAFGAVKGVVDSVWEMEDALKVRLTHHSLVSATGAQTHSLQAYERVETHRARGKVLVRVQEE